jgi:hypothetical protein
MATDFAYWTVCFSSLSLGALVSAVFVVAVAVARAAQPDDVPRYLS